MKCFFAGRPGWGPCDGPLIRAHLIPKQAIRREMWPILRVGTTSAPTARGRLHALVWDGRCWVPCCGGLTGIGGHHGKLDSPIDPTRLPRADLPEAVERFAAELDELVGREVFASLLDRNYGTRGS